MASQPRHPALATRAMAVRLQTRLQHRARRALFAVSRIGLWWVLAVVALSVDPPVTPPILFRLVLALVVLPGCAAFLLRGRPAEAEVDGDSLVVRSDRVRLEVPCEAIGGLRPSWLPLPDVGLDVVLRSGKRIAPGLELDDAVPLLSSLAEAGAPAAAALAAPSVVFARAKAGVVRRLWDHPLVKFGLIPLLPTALLFNVHQHIAHGAFWGEWLTYGAWAWLTTLATYWAVTTIYCVLFASVWRGTGEAAAMAAAAVAPARAAQVRRLVEAACRLGYPGGILLVLGLRFLP
jgi:hypothetical protein